MARRIIGSIARAALPALAAVSLAAGVARADDPPRTITFEEAIGIALKQNITVRQAQNATALDAASVRQQRMQFLPSLSMNAGTSGNLGRNFSETEGRIVDQTTQSVNGGISSSVTLFDSLRNVANLKQAQLSQDASEQDLARARQTAVFSVASNFVSLVAQQEQLRVQQENLESQQALENQIDQFVKAGVRPISDLYQQHATMASARASVVEAQRALDLAKVDLIQTLQLDPTAEYEFEPPTIDASAVATMSFNLDSLLARALANRADLHAQSTLVEAAEQGSRAAGAGKWPTISLTAGYNSSFSTANDVGFMDQIDQRRGGSIGIGISIPLFDRGSTSIASEKAALQEENARLALSNQRQQVALEVRRAYLDYRAAQERLNAAEAQEKAASLAVTTSQERYRVGAATLVEITQARASQVQAASALVNARYNLVFQQALMSYYTGELEPGSVRLG